MSQTKNKPKENEDKTMISHDVLEQKRLDYEKAKEEAEKLGAAKSNIMFIPTLIYAVLTTFFLYKNFSGITMPLFAVLTCLYALFLWKKLRPEAKEKRGWIFFLVGMLLLGTANTITARDELIVYNNLMMFVLIVGLVIYFFYNQKSWTLSKYIAVFFESMIGAIGSIGDLFGDSIAAIRLNKNEKTKTIVYCLIGVAIFIPVGGVLISLLASADIIFQNLLKNAVEMLSIDNLFGIIAFCILAFACAYCGIRYADSGKTKSTVTDHRLFPIAIAKSPMRKLSESAKLTAVIFSALICKRATSD